MDEGILQLVLIIVLGLLVLGAFYVGRALGKRYMFEVMQHVVEEEKKKSVEKSRSVLKGQFSEQLSPFEKDFPGKPSEARFMGAPIDFVVFKGLDENNVEEIILIDVKTGNSRLSQSQKSIQKAVENNKVSFKVYRM